ncbi:MATE efflux family protein [Perkinsela sp. CCAP 1560/4]|nr:MATE efflux family protein [Perkinsela sp. CCAP 1560/4]|eukprot:KNH03798.1 MATE efflux family protein [Perkinsela sp. CCAP 1560/4]
MTPSGSHSNESDSVRLTTDKVVDSQGPGGAPDEHQQEKISQPLSTPNYTHPDYGKLVHANNEHNSAIVSDTALGTDSNAGDSQCCVATENIIELPEETVESIPLPSKSQEIFHDNTENHKSQEEPAESHLMQASDHGFRPSVKPYQTTAAPHIEQIQHKSSASNYSIVESQTTDAVDLEFRTAIGDAILIAPAAIEHAARKYDLPIPHTRAKANNGKRTDAQKTAIQSGTALLSHGDPQSGWKAPWRKLANTDQNRGEKMSRSTRPVTVSSNTSGKVSYPPPKGEPLSDTQN